MTNAYIRRLGRKSNYERVAVFRSVDVVTRCHVPDDDAKFFRTLEVLTDGLHLKDDGHLYRTNTHVSEWGHVDSEDVCVIENAQNYPELEVVVLAARLMKIMNEEKAKIEEARGKTYTKMQTALKNKD